MSTLVGEGYVYLSSGAVEEAAACADEAIGLDRGHAEGYTLLAHVRLRTADFDGAREAASRALRECPGHRGALFVRGTARKMLGDLLSSLEDFDAILSQDAGDWQAGSERAGVLRRLGAGKELLDATMQAREQTKAAYGSLLSVAVAFVSMQELDEALVYLDEVIEQQPLCAEAYLWRGQVRKQLGDYSSAMDDYQRFVDYYPKSACAYVLMCFCLTEQGNFREAMRYTEEASGLGFRWDERWLKELRHRAEAETTQGDEE